MQEINAQFHFNLMIIIDGDVVLKLYGFPYSPNTEKVHFFLESMDIPYTYQLVDLVTGGQRSQQVLQLNSKGRIPFIETGDFVLSESQAILRYLADKHGRNKEYPEDLQQRSLLDARMEFVGNHLARDMSIVVWEQHYASLLELQSKDRRSITAEQRILRDLPVVEGWLAESPHLSGADLGLADFCLFPSAIVFLKLFPKKLGSCPHLKQWLKRLESEPSWQAVLTKRQMIPSLSL